MDNELKAILDVRGLIMHAMFRGEDPEGTRDLETGKIEPRAQYGFESFLESYMVPITEDIAPRNIIAVWDGGSAFRKGIFPTYKKKRGERVISEFLKEQQAMLFKQTKDFLAGLGCLQCRVDRVEADDVIALLCDKLSGHKFVYTVDNDLVALHREGECTVFVKNEPTSVYQHKSGSGDNKRVTQVPHDLITLFKSMVGDSSDEYPGVAGLGPAKWVKLVEDFDWDGMEELEECVKHTNFKMIEEALKDEAHPVLQMLWEHKYEWALQYGLARFHPELCEGYRDKQLAKIEWFKRVPNKERTQRVMAWAGATDLFFKFQTFMPTQALVTTATVDGDIAHFCDHLPATPFIAFDYESFDCLDHPDFQKAKKSGFHVDVLSQSITGCSFTYGNNMQHTIYLSVDHADTQNLEDTVIWDFLDECEQQGKALVAHHAPFEIALTDTNFLKQLKEVICTRIMAVYVDEEESAHLKDLSSRYLKYKQATYKETLESADVCNMRELTGKQVLGYGCDDAFVTAGLFDLFHIILQIEGTWEFCRANEFDTNYTLYNGFEAGMNIDFDRLKELAAEDQIVIDTGMAAVKTALLEHCKKVNEESASALYTDLAEFEQVKMAKDGKSEESIIAKLATMWDTVLQGSKYIPLSEVSKGVEFKPTKTQIAKVAEALDFGTPITKISKSGINEWVVVANLETGMTDQKREFIELLIDASGQLNKREGIQYAIFHTLCEEILQKGAPTETVGDELNFDSPAQMQRLFYGKLGLPIRVRSKVQFNSSRDKLDFHGAPGTNDKAIDAALAEDCLDDSDWRRQVLLDLRAVKGCMTRFKFFYVPYPLWQHPRDGKVHGFIQNCGTVTHRFTGSDPNELQVPSRDGGRVRTMIKPFRNDMVILSPDFNGEELRITASLSKDPVMTDAYIGEIRKDLHSLTASAIAPIMLPRLDPNFIDLKEKGLSYEDFLWMLKGEDKDVAQMCKLVRGLAKTVNFLIIYVGGAGSLALNLGVPKEVAQAFIDATMLTYPRLGPWQDESIEFARDHGYVLTSYGNRRHLGRGIYSDNAYIRTKNERQAVNSQVQGTGSDIIKVVLGEMHRRKLLQRMKGKLLVPPYDECAISVPRSAAWDSWLEMQDIMTLTPPGNIVPQLPELKASALNWGTCIELGAFPTEDELNECFDKQLAERKAA